MASLFTISLIKLNKMRNEVIEDPGALSEKFLKIGFVALITVNVYYITTLFLDILSM
jgi:hypothetical protein